MATSPDPSRRLAALKRKLGELEQRRSLARFLPPYTDAELADVENKLGVRLPDDQRAFVLEVTRGEEDSGTPPMYPPHQGMTCLGPGDTPSAPFAFDDAETAAFLGAVEERKRRGETPALQAPMHGLLPILDHGDGEYACVVLAGEQRGKMWSWWEGGLAPIYEVKKKQARQLDFLTWAERALEDALRAAPPPINAGAKEIDLSGQQLTTVPDVVFVAVAAEKLDLSANALGALPEEISRLGELRTLGLSSNLLSGLPATLGQLSKLERLYASDNRLESLPDSIGGLAALVRLDLFNNQLRALPATVSGLTRLVELDLDNNPLAELPESLGAMGSLRTLKVAQTPLIKLPEGLTRTSLEAMDLNRLPELDLDQALGVLAGVASLTTLEISGHGSRTLPPLGRFSRIKVLRLVKFGLREVPRDVLELPDLETLSLGHNLLGSVPDALFALPKLRDLSLSSNPMDKGYVAALRARFPHVTIRF
jgi:Leucine-rich repeat (LRR) protein